MLPSIWEKQSFYAHKDIIIAGAGLAGLWTALELIKFKDKLRILILDKGVIPTGASSRNAGFACFGSPTELLHDAAFIGEDKMFQLAEMRYKGIEKIRNTFADDVIDYDNCGGYEILGNDYAHLNQLDEKLQWLNARLEKITKLTETFKRVDNKLNAFEFKGFAALIENKLEGSLHSGKLVQALTKKVLALGIEIITSTEVTRYENSNGTIKVYTNRDIHFTAGKLLFCTNAFTSSIVKNVVVTPARGQVLVTSPIENLSFAGTFHFDEGFYYFRNLGNRVLLGGARNKAFEEETTTSLETSAIVQNELERFLQQHILAGKDYTIEHRWSGIMGFTNTKEPLVKQTEPNVYVVITCNGMGVALAPVIAQQAARLVLQ